VPDLPTVAESGLPGFDVTAWFALYAPRNTPEPVVRQLIEAARSGLQSPAIARNFAGMGAKPGTLFGADLAAFESEERKKWGGLIKDKGITAQ
jgi:tripartite-type tricarboxylate transporter receptor subunit TctC